MAIAVNIGTEFKTLDLTVESRNQVEVREINLAVTADIPHRQMFGLATIDEA